MDVFFYFKICEPEETQTHHLTLELFKNYKDINYIYPEVFCNMLLATLISRQTKNGKI